MMRFSRRRGRGSGTWVTIALLAVVAAAAGVWSYTEARVDSPASVRLVGETADGLIGAFTVSETPVKAGEQTLFPCGAVENRTTATARLSLDYTVTHDVYGSSVVNDVYFVKVDFADPDVAAGDRVDIECDVYVAEPGTYTVGGTVQAEWSDGKAEVPFETVFTVNP